MDITIVYHPGTLGGVYYVHSYDAETGNYGHSVTSYATRESAQSAVDRDNVRWATSSADA